MSEQDSIHLLNSALSGFQFMESLDKIKNTTLYKHDFKNRVNSVIKDLEKHCNLLFNGLDGNENEALFTLMESKKEIVSELACMRPEVAAAAIEMVKRLKAEPEVFLAHNQVFFNKPEGV